MAGSGNVQNITNLTDQDIVLSLSAPGATDKKALIAPSTSTNLTFGVSGTEMMRINNAGNVGIGTSTPGYPLDVIGNIRSTNQILTGYGSFSTPGLLIGDGQYGMYVSSGMLFTKSSAAGQYYWRNAANTDNLFGIDGNGNTYTKGSGFFGNKIGIGTQSPDEMLTVNGKIHAKEVRIDTSVPTVPDYVFNKNYPLMSLTDIKNYVDKNHHLPEVPSAAEVAKNGLKLAEMNLLLLKKVEELTLHLIEKDEQLKTYKKTIDDLKTAQENIEKKLNKLLNQPKQ